MKKNILILAASLLSTQVFAVQEIQEVDINETILSLESTISEYHYATESEDQNYSDNHSNYRQARKKSPFSQLGASDNNVHAKADAVFTNIENLFPTVFPNTSPAAEEYPMGDGSFMYMKIYKTEAALVEYQGYLFYLIPGYELEFWGLISDWKF